jgi:tRNA(Ile)-lysidine synthase
MYHGRMQPLPEIVLGYIRKHRLLVPGDRVGVAVSGGADSVALLRLLLELRHELGIVLSVVHFNHKLRDADSEEDQRFVADLAQQYKLEFHSASGDVAQLATKEHLSLETAARKLRYQYFRELLGDGRLTRIATAHTLDDQAETVLLRMVRGAGTRGLAGIYPQLSVPNSQFSEIGRIVRPLLSVRRKDLEGYLSAIGQTWREDKSNRDLRHARNRVRHEILPRLEQALNPAVREVLAETAEIARAEEEYWQKETNQLLSSAWKSGAGQGTLKVDVLTSLPLAFQRRLVRAAAEDLGLRLEFRHVAEILGQLAKEAESAKSTVLPDGWTLALRRGELLFGRAVPPTTSPDYDFPLPLPGTVEVRPTRSRFEAVLVPGNAVAVYNPDHLLDRMRLGQELRIRNWRPGDRFWPTHTKAPKKIKELLQSLHLSGPERRLWPVVVSGKEVIWMRGFAAPSEFHARTGGLEAVLIRETPL